MEKCMAVHNWLDYVCRLAECERYANTHASSKAPPPHQAGVLYHWGLSNAESGHDLIFLILVTADVIIKVLQPAKTGCLYLCNIARNWKREGGRGRGKERERERERERWERETI